MTRCARTHPKRMGAILLLAAVVLAMPLLLSACGSTEDPVDATSIQPEATDDSAVEPDENGASGSVELSVIAGTYEASYGREGHDESYPASFTISPDGIIEGEGELIGGWGTFAISGAVDASGGFSAGGEVEGVGEEVSWTGAFDVSGDVVTISGVWTMTGGNPGGTWTAAQQ